jgi:hypothetical protein
MNITEARHSGIQMKARRKSDGLEVTVAKGNPASPFEFIALFPGGDSSSEFYRDYEPIDFDWSVLDEEQK